jgi:tetratricopeptide (TPR) repeat protein
MSQLVKGVLYAAVAVAAVAAAAMQLIANGATGSAAAAFSVPRAVAEAIGAGPAQRLGLNLKSTGEGVLSITARVDRLDKANDYRGAAALERELAARLQNDQFAQEAYVNALWRLGQLDAEIGYREPTVRRQQWKQALSDYERGLRLEPLSETLLLAAGNQALLNGDRAAAKRYFRRAVSVDPASKDAKVGLHKAITGEGVPPPFVAPAEWAARKR